MEVSKVVGIDLGTSTSEIAYLKDGKPFIIPNLKGNKITPSIVYISDDGEVKVGEDALSYTVLEPENTVIEVKRLMGTQNSLKLGKKYLKPQEVSCYILKYLKLCAESYLGEALEEAVITVPAYFTNEQRIATKEAGELAGFKVERIINEPTAAALAYGLEHMKDQKYVLVYDFGGGTLDVTVLEMFDGVLDVKASCGNNKLGGKDFDETLINKLTSEFEKINGINLEKDRKAMARLKEATEKVKIELSSKEHTLVDLPFLASKDGKPYGIYRSIARSEFEDLIGDMVRSTITQIDSALADAKLTPQEIDTILLIGGSTRIPLVKNTLKDKFTREPKHEINPDEAVALGAAIQAGIMMGQFSEANDIILTDVCPYTLGIECVKEVLGINMPGMLDVLIKRNTTIPASVNQIYRTFVDNQQKARINVYQGESVIAYENNLIGNFMIEDIPAANAGEEKIDVEFSYDINGIVEVKAKLPSTGNNTSIRIDTREIKINEEINVEEGWKKSGRAKKLKSLIRKAEKILARKSIQHGFGEELETLLYELKYALTKNDDVFINRYEDELTDLLYNAGKRSTDGC